MKRIFLGIALLLSILYFPWWITLLVSLIGFLAYPSYPEALFAGLAFDMLYSMPVPGLWGFRSFGALAALILFFLMPWLKRYIVFYPNSFS